MNTITWSLVIIVVFIVTMTLILKKTDNEKIILIGDFFTKVLPRIPFGKIFKRKKKESS